MLRNTSFWYLKYILRLVLDTEVNDECYGTKIDVFQVTKSIE